MRTVRLVVFGVSIAVVGGAVFASWDGVLRWCEDRRLRQHVARMDFKEVPLRVVLQELVDGVAVPVEVLACDELLGRTVTIQSEGPMTLVDALSLAARLTDVALLTHQGAHGDSAVPYFQCPRGGSPYRRIGTRGPD